MSSRRRIITTVASRLSTPPPGVVQPPVRWSPRALPRLNYREKRTRSTSSVASTGRCPETTSCLKIAMKASLINSQGETQYRGSGVFLLSGRSHRSALHARTKEILAEVLGVGLNSNPVEPVTEAARFDFDQWCVKHKKDRQKSEMQRTKIAKLEAKLKEQRRSREVAQARAEKRKVGEPSVAPPPGYHSPCSGELEAIKQEEEDKEPDSPSAYQIRTRSPSTKPSGAPSHPW